MDSHELFRELFQRVPPKQIASEMGLSTSLVYKWSQPVSEGGSGSANPLDRVEKLLELTRDSLLAQWICQRAGGFFVRNAPPGKTVCKSSVAARTHEVVQEFAEMLSSVAMAASDNVITAEEAEEIRAQWERVKSATEEYVQACERGSFEGLFSELGSRGGEG